MNDPRQSFDAIVGTGRAGKSAITEALPNRDRQIGAILVDTGRMSISDAERVLEEQRRTGVVFGEIALRLGVVKPEDIQFALSRQFAYPYLPEGDASLSDSVVAAYKPFGKFSESMRALRSQLMLRWFTGSPRHAVLSIISAERKAGRSFLAANLAVVFSQMGERTLLIDADLRNPCQHQLFKVQNQYGLTAILSGRAGTEQIVRLPFMLDLSILPAGSLPPNPQELLGRRQFAALLDQVSSEYGVVIVDTCAAQESADAQVVATQTRGALILGRQHQTQHVVLNQLNQSLRRAGVEIVGSVLNDH